MNLIPLIILVHIYKSQIFKSRKLNLQNEITITINGKGSQNILYSQYEFKPNEILLNGQNSNIDEENKILILEKEENIVTMKWNNKLIDSRKMFQNLTNIIEIDLTKFDSSDVEKMDYMFNRCTNLKKIIINNSFDTSKVRSMSFCLIFVNH